MSLKFSLWFVLSAVTLAIFVPFGMAGSLYSIFQFVKRRQRLKRFVTEVHTALLASVMLFFVIPLQSIQYLASLMNFQFPPQLAMIRTVVFRSLQVILIINVTVIAIKRAKSIIRRDPSNSPNKLIVIVSLSISWIFGITIGVTTIQDSSAHCGNYQNESLPLENHNCIRPQVFHTIYLILLLLSASVMLGSCISVRRYINSAIAGSSASETSRMNRVNVIGALAKGLGDNLAVQFVTANGRRTTVISSPIETEDTGIVTSRVVVDNWIAEKPTQERIKSFDTSSTISSEMSRSRSRSGRNTSAGCEEKTSVSFTSTKPTEEHMSISLINIPLMTKLQSFDIIEEEENEDGDSLSEEEIIERLSVKFHPNFNHAHSSDTESISKLSFSSTSCQDNISQVSTSTNKSCRTVSRSVSSVLVKKLLQPFGITLQSSNKDNEYQEQRKHSQTTKEGNKPTVTNSPAILHKDVSALTPRNKSSETGNERSEGISNQTDVPDNELQRKESSPGKKTMDDNVSVSSRSSRNSAMPYLHPASPTWSVKSGESQSAFSDSLHPITWSSLSRFSKKTSSNSEASSICLPPLKHTRSSPSSVSLKSPAPLYDFWSGQNERNCRSLEKEDSMDILDLPICKNNRSISMMEKEELPSSLQNKDFPDQNFTEHDGDKEKKVQADENLEIEPSVEDEGPERAINPPGINRAVSSHPPAVQIRVTRPSTENVRFLHRRNGLVQDEIILKPDLKSIVADEEPRDSKVPSISRRSSPRKVTFPYVNTTPGRKTTVISEPCHSVSVQQSNTSTVSKPFRRNTLRYKETVVRRFAMAFAINIATQVPVTILQMISEETEESYLTMMPLFQSIAITSFCLSPYLYILGNKIIHKIIFMVGVY